MHRLSAEMGFDSNDCSHVDTETLDILHRYVRFEFASRKAAVLTSFPLHSPDFYAGDPYPAYRELRATTPVVWNDVTKFWALTKYEDVRFVSGHPGLFTSTKGITIPDPGQPEPVQEGNLIFTDPPRHRQLRKLLNSGFTRRQVTLLEPKVREIVKGILDGVDLTREHEFA